MIQLWTEAKGKAYERITSRFSHRSSFKKEEATNPAYLCKSKVTMQDALTESRMLVKRNAFASRSLPTETLFATHRARAVSMPAEVREKQSAYTGKINWYSPTPSSPNVWLRKIL